MILSLNDWNLVGPYSDRRARTVSLPGVVASSAGIAKRVEAFSPEFMTLLERFCRSGTAADAEKFGDFLSPNEHRARLSMILDFATDAARHTYARLFADWVRLKRFSEDVTEFQGVPWIIGHV